MVAGSDAIRALCLTASGSRIRWGELRRTWVVGLGGHHETSTRICWGARGRICKEEKGKQIYSPPSCPIPATILYIFPYHCSLFVLL